MHQIPIRRNTKHPQKKGHKKAKKGQNKNRLFWDIN